MRILLAQNSLYYPSHGGGDISNRLLMEALAARGHECRAVARIPIFGLSEMQRYLASLSSRGVAPDDSTPGVARFVRNGVDVRVVVNTPLRAYFDHQASEFRPDVILASTDDPPQVLLEAALASTAHVVYLARATLALPFGPDCAFPSASKTARIRAADAVVGVSEYVARYVREHGGMDAVHAPISLMEPGDWPALGRFENEFVTISNPCAVKGISIFLALADAFPEQKFAAVAGWGTNREDRAALAARSNIQQLDPVDEIDILLARTKVMLAPSLWAEARSRMVVEAMLRGVPVMAANTGGLPEAKLGVPYLLPVHPITHYQPRVDEQMVPVAEAPPQDAGPWRYALARLLSDRAHYRKLSAQSREAALAYAGNLSSRPFEDLLKTVVARPKRSLAMFAAPAGAPGSSAPRPSAPAQFLDSLSPEKRQLFALRLRQMAPPAAWFPGAETAKGIRLFCFPHAGGGATAYAGWTLAESKATVCPVRFPGRESRAAEAPFERMAQLIDALASAIRHYLDMPFAFFGHSMGAVVAFELARRLRDTRLPAPLMLIASAARAPQYRRNYTPPPAPTDEQFRQELRRLEGLPAETLDDPMLLAAVLPALRADTALYRKYVYMDDEPLSFPIRAYGGLSDSNIRAEHLEAWAAQTSADFAVRTFPGGHFYLNLARQEALAALAGDLACVS